MPEEITNEAVEAVEEVTEPQETATGQVTELTPATIGFYYLIEGKGITGECVKTTAKTLTLATKDGKQTFKFNEVTVTQIDAMTHFTNR
jgi:hypothetical protein